MNQNKRQKNHRPLLRLVWDTEYARVLHGMLTNSEYHLSRAYESFLKAFNKHLDMFKEQGYILSDNDIVIQELENTFEMKTEKQFNQWITHQFYEKYNKHITVQRIETTTGNGVPDLLILTQDKTWIIESKFETTRLRPEQKAWQIKANSIPTDTVVSHSLPTPRPSVLLYNSTMILAL